MPPQVGTGDLPSTDDRRLKFTVEVAESAEETERGNGTAKDAKSAKNNVWKGRVFGKTGSHEGTEMPGSRRLVLRLIA